MRWRVISDVTSKPRRRRGQPGNLVVVVGVGVLRVRGLGAVRRGRLSGGDLPHGRLWLGLGVRRRRLPLLWLRLLLWKWLSFRIDVKHGRRGAEHRPIHALAIITQLRPPTPPRCRRYSSSSSSSSVLLLRKHLLLHHGCR